MTIAESMLPEFDQEMANTRKALECVPDGRLDWRPHEKSYTMGQLANHIANLLTWAPMTVEHDQFDMTPKDGEVPKTPQAVSAAAALAAFEKNSADARAAIAATTDATMMSPWSLVMNGEALFTMPKVAVLRSFVMNHLIHHRAQLSVYLRLCDVPVPAIYGPSADDAGM